MKVYNYLSTHTTGVYKKKDGENYTWQHYVKLIGLGEEDGTKYWLAANSWGTSKHENGFFKIARGTNECEIEDDCIAVQPKTENKKRKRRAHNPAVPLCNGNGKHPFGHCSKVYWSCSNDMEFKAHCPAGLYYDSELSRCDKKEFIPECGGNRPDAFYTSDDFAPVKVNFDCKGKYGYKVQSMCSVQFSPCVDGEQHDTCPQGKTYGRRVLSCHYPARKH